jgi:lipopolysaccharide/colanic/teichoic acid biosynthesis glycosyltransferase
MRQAQRIILAPAEGEMRGLEATIDDVPLLWLRLRLGLVSRSSRAVKRIFDIAVALLLLGSPAPICLIVSLVIIRSGGPIFFAHERVGRGGRIFKYLKFRTSLWSDIVILLRMMPVTIAGQRAC